MFTKPLFSITFKGNGLKENSKGSSLKQGKPVCGVKLDPLTHSEVKILK